MCRHPSLAKRVAGLDPAADEVLASLAGAVLLEDGTDREDLIAKALFDVAIRNNDLIWSRRLVSVLLELLEAIL